jgi:uncharacterized protein YchJ
MGLADIQEKQSEERKREKRLVRFANTVTRDFLDSKHIKSKTTQEPVAYITKGFLDYLFFEAHKEIRELYDEQLNHFMMDFAPRKLVLTSEQAKEAAVILADLLAFLEDNGHIHNGHELSAMAKKNAGAFAKLFPKTAKKESGKAKKNVSGKNIKKATAKAKFTNLDIGRNAPCPCGSGKKYKKCCGKNA